MVIKSIIPFELAHFSAKPVRFRVFLIFLVGASAREYLLLVSDTFDGVTEVGQEIAIHSKLILTNKE